MTSFPKVPYWIYVYLAANDPRYIPPSVGGIPFKPLVDGDLT